MNYLPRPLVTISIYILTALCVSCRTGAPYSQDPADSLAPASGRYYGTYQKWPATLEQAEKGATQYELEPMAKARDAKFMPQADGTLRIEWTKEDGSRGSLHIRAAQYGQVVILDKK
jgi:hypothetical protein